MKIHPMTLLRVFLPFAAGYFISYIYRVVNAVIAPDLVADIGVGPSALGLLTATYFISFASFQLPLGVLLDRFGPRKVEAGLLFFAALGAFIFARAESLAGLITGRAFIGFGVSACLMAAFKAYTLWFSREKWPLVNGFQMAAGGLGALAATSPVEAALQFTDWRGVFIGLALLTLIIAGSIFFIVPEKTSEGTGESLHNQMRGIHEVFASRKFWRTAPLTTVSQATFLAIQGLWAGPWLTHVAGFERTQVARLLFWVAVAMIAGFIVLGTIAERLSKRGVSVGATAVTCMFLFMIVQVLLILGPPAWCVPVWLAFGFLGTSSIIAYSALSQSFPVHLSGRVTTAVNLLVFITAFVAQWALGGIIDFFTRGESTLSPTGFTAGFSLLLLLELAGIAYYVLAGRKQIDHS
ncbi:MFS transporter [Desulfopila sp. IMCC35006]|uniref:MFS transporter n=1 Tax=Desulfopila sp. IMCC35006 TaxID=2569542 RepID=UPI0010ACFF18|nr:MFS transporter [Desulfopila sp. IMCC35006]TKB26677.1 MFS transporter [Desulfopila sp. IMCC35006]